MSELFNENLILGYVEGDLPDAERAQFEKDMARDPQLRRLVEQLVEDRGALRAMPGEQAPNDLIERITEQLERQSLMGQTPLAIAGKVAAGKTGSGGSPVGSAGPKLVNGQARTRRSNHTMIIFQRMILTGVAAVLAVGAGLMIWMAWDDRLMERAGDARRSVSFNVEIKPEPTRSPFDAAPAVTGQDDRLASRSDLKPQASADSQAAVSSSARPAAPHAPPSPSDAKFAFADQDTRGESTPDSAFRSGTRKNYVGEMARSTTGVDFESAKSGEPVELDQLALGRSREGATSLQETVPPTVAPPLPATTPAPERATESFTQTPAPAADSAPVQIEGGERLAGTIVPDARPAEAMANVATEIAAAQPIAAAEVPVPATPGHDERTAMTTAARLADVEGTADVAQSLRGMATSPPAMKETTAASDEAALPSEPTASPSPISDVAAVTAPSEPSTSSSAPVALLSPAPPRISPPVSPTTPAPPAPPAAPVIPDALKPDAMVELGDGLAASDTRLRARLGAIAAPAAADLETIAPRLAPVTLQVNIMTADPDRAEQAIRDWAAARGTDVELDSETGSVMTLVPRNSRALTVRMPARLMPHLTDHMGRQSGDQVRLIENPIPLTPIHAEQAAPAASSTTDQPVSKPTQSTQAGRSPAREQRQRSDTDGMNRVVSPWSLLLRQETPLIPGAPLYPPDHRLTVPVLIETQSGSNP